MIADKIKHSDAFTQFTTVADTKFRAISNFHTSFCAFRAQIPEIQYPLLYLQ